MKHLLSIAVMALPWFVQAQLYTQDFESFAVGDYIAVEGAPIWATWTAGNEGTTMDAQVSDEAALSGTQSLKIFGGVGGGPMDIMLIAGLTGAYEVTFNMLIPDGNSGYYNVQENQIPGTAWAFECNLNGNGTVNYNIDGGTYYLYGTYTPGTWLKITHEIDTDSDLMNVYFDDVFLGQLPYDGAQIGGVNFFAAGDGLTVPTYYVDDVFIDVADNVVAWVPEGCTDTQACNFVPGAINDDGSCEYETCAGCTDLEACNFDNLATLENGTCDYDCYGCTDASASNFDPASTIEDGSCVYFVATCDYLGNPAWDEYLLGLFGEGPVQFVQGIAGSLDLVQNTPSVIQDATTGTPFAVLSWTPTFVENLPSDLVLDGVVSSSGGEQSCVSLFGTGWEVGTHVVVVHGDLILSVFGNPYPVGDYPMNLLVDILPNPEGVPGCTYANASNFSPFATLDDGSCYYLGCTDPSASNFTVYATMDDGSCEMAPCQSTCPNDIDQDGAIGTSDLLSLLSGFGFICE